MQRELSLYLDLVRITSAMVVFLAHATGVSGGLFAQLWEYSFFSTAVTIFFVLSGYVIGYVSSNKETCIEDYTVARFARLYSVIIPALILTLICGAITIRFNGPFSDKIQSLSYLEHLVRYLLTLINLQHIWFIDKTPGLNGPFWSLSNEFIYYCLFAVIFYLRDYKRIFLAMLFMLLGGPMIVLTFPIWMMGYYTYKIHQSNRQLLTNTKIGASISILSLIVLIIVSPLIKSKGYLVIDVSFFPRTEILTKYVDAISFTLHLMFIHTLLPYIGSVLRYFSKSIQWSASLSFSLYLFHLPLITTVPLLYYEDKSALSSRLILYGITLIIVATLGHWCERNKYKLKLIVSPFIYRLYKSNRK